MELGSIEETTKPGLAEFTADLFRPRVGTIFTFYVTLPDGNASDVAAELELVEVSEPASGSTNRAAEWRKPFSLIFVLRTGTVAASGFCRMTHDSFEPADLLLSRIVLPRSGPGSTEQYYEAAFG